MQPLELACRHTEADGTNCGAEAGEACVWREPHDGVVCHAERIEDAASFGEGDGEADSVAFDEAVEHSGLV